MYEDQLKIPKERIAVLVGKKGSTKKEIESKTKTKIEISKDGDVLISCEDTLKIYVSKSIIKAIGRGFNPELALKLLDEDYCFEMIDIRTFAGKSKNKTLRLKGRAIGQQGKSRKTIEDLTNTNISVYGKTVSVLGKIDDVILARRALESLLRGSRHGNVYKWLEKQKKLQR